MNTSSQCIAPVKKCQVEVFILCNRYFKIVSEANTSEHWTKKRKRIAAQHKVVFFSLAEKKPSGSIELPCEVIMTRYGSKLYDDDNLIAAMKHVRDSIANYINPGLAPGQADNDKRIKWTCLQVTVSDKNLHGIRIEIY